MLNCLIKITDGAAPAWGSCSVRSLVALNACGLDDSAPSLDLGGEMRLQGIGSGESRSDRLGAEAGEAFYYFRVLESDLKRAHELVRHVLGQTLGRPHGVPRRDFE